MVQGGFNAALSAGVDWRIGFRLVPGFTERVIFRDLYLQGLTLLDLDDAGVNRLTLSNVAARQELRELIKALNLPLDRAA